MEIKSTGESSSSAISQGIGSASGSLGGLAGAIGGAISAVVSVTLLVAVVTTYILTAPIITTSDWKILFNSISFVFVAEESDNDFYINLYEGESLLETVVTDSLERMISFENLEAEHSYTITVENDYGSGLKMLKEFNVKTAGAPILPNGKILVTSHDLNYATANLSITLDLVDEAGYLSNFRINVSDSGGSSFDAIKDVDVLPEDLNILLHNLQRGYITVTIYADSTFLDGSLGGLYTTYKVYY